MLQRLRLVTGLVIFAFVLTHFLNHILVLYSIELAETARIYFVGFWRSWLPTIALYGSLLTHAGLALLKLLQRRSLRMPIAELTQLSFGLLVPWLVVSHIVRTRLSHDILGVEDSYTYELVRLWPTFTLSQSLLLLLVWAHVSIGLYYYLRLKPGFHRWRDLFFIVGGAIPLLALAAFMVGGRLMDGPEGDPVWLAQFKLDSRWPDQAGSDWQLTLISRLEWGWIGLVVLTLIVRQTMMVVKQSGAALIEYVPGRRVSLVPGATLLEVSRAYQIPHASVCGGRGRCSTCRVRVNSGEEAIEPPSAEESAVLARVHAPPNVRLACQIRPRASMSVTPLLPPRAEPKEAFDNDRFRTGSEQKVCVLFADLRGYTKMAEGRLPFDVVFILNEYFRVMGQAIEQCGGRVDKFIGDGIMALFGLDTGSGVACRQALSAVAEMNRALALLNESLHHDLRQPLKMGIGLHFGQAIVGRMGHGDAVSLTAIGDTVNTASRLESMTKELGAELIISLPVAQKAGMDLRGQRRERLDIRGRERSMEVIVFERIEALPPFSEALREMAL